MARIAEKFGLVEVEEFGGKVRLMTEAELLPRLYMEASCGRSVGKSVEHIEEDIRSRYGATAVRVARSFKLI